MINNGNDEKTWKGISVNVASLEYIANLVDDLQVPVLDKSYLKQASVDEIREICRGDIPRFFGYSALK